MKQVAILSFVATFGLAVVTAAEDLDFVIVTQTPNGPVIDPSDNPGSKFLDAKDQAAAIIAALSGVELEESGIEPLADLIGQSSDLKDVPPDDIARIESKILAWVKPLPATNLEGNLKGYYALAILRPDIPAYANKRDEYQQKITEKRRSILKNYRTETDDFNGITWYTHRDQPRYTDTRTFVALYIGAKEGYRPILRFKLNYTGTGWLFVERAQVNVDGEIFDVPASDWKRDNDTEIWEWIDVEATDFYTNLAARIANSKKTVIRFNGQQYYDNYTVSTADKTVLRDGLVAHEVLKESVD